MYKFRFPMHLSFLPISVRYVFVNVAAGQKPGYASVEVFTEDKAHSLGTTGIFYLSKGKRKKWYQQLVHDPNRQREFFHEWAASRGSAGGSMSGSPSSSSLGKSFIIGLVFFSVGFPMSQTYSLKLI